MAQNQAQQNLDRYLAAQTAGDQETIREMEIDINFGVTFPVLQERMALVWAHIQATQGCKVREELLRRYYPEPAICRSCGDPSYPYAIFCRNCQGELR